MRSIASLDFLVAPVDFVGSASLIWLSTGLLSFPVVSVRGATHRRTPVSGTWGRGRLLDESLETVDMRVLVRCCDNSDKNLCGSRCAVEFSQVC